MKLPENFEAQMKQLLGDGYDDYLASLNAPAHYGLRVNTAKISVEEFIRISPFKLRPVPWCPSGFYYDPAREKPAKHPYYHAGLYYLQEPSAMLLGEVLEIEDGDVILDGCAAPGGKSCFAAELAHKGKVLSFDLSDGKVDLIKDNAKRLKLDNLKAEVHYALEFDY